MEEHVVHMYEVVSSDQNVTVEEMNLLYHFAAEYGIGKERVDFLVANPHMAISDGLQDQTTRIGKLYDHCKLILEDSQIVPSELRVLNAIMFDLGFDSQHIKHLIKTGIELLKREIGISRFEFAKLILPEVDVQPQAKICTGIIVNENFELSILPDNRTIKLPVVEKVFYLFFLIADKPISIKNLIDKIDTLSVIYNKIKPEKDPELIRKLLLDQWTNKLIDQKLSKIKRAIATECIDLENLDSILISGQRGKEYGIAISKSLISFQHDFFKQLLSAIN